MYACSVYIEGNRRFGDGVTKTATIAMDYDGWQRIDCTNVGWVCPICNLETKLADLRFSVLWASVLLSVPEKIDQVRVRACCVFAVLVATYMIYSLTTHTHPTSVVFMRQVTFFPDGTFGYVSGEFKCHQIFCRIYIY